MKYIDVDHFTILSFDAIFQKNDLVLLRALLTLIHNFHWMTINYDKLYQCSKDKNLKLVEIYPLSSSASNKIFDSYLIIINHIKK